MWTWSVCHSSVTLRTVHSSTVLSRIVWSMRFGSKSLPLMKKDGLGGGPGSKPSERTISRLRAIGTPRRSSTGTSSEGIGRGSTARPPIAMVAIVRVGAL